MPATWWLSLSSHPHPPLFSTGDTESGTPTTSLLCQKLPGEGTAGLGKRTCPSHPVSPAASSPCRGSSCYNSSSHMSNTQSSCAVLPGGHSGRWAAPPQGSGPSKAISFCSHFPAIGAGGGEGGTPSGRYSLNLDSFSPFPCQQTCPSKQFLTRTRSVHITAF